MDFRQLNESFNSLYQSSKQDVSLYEEFSPENFKNESLDFDDMSNFNSAFYNAIADVCFQFRDKQINRDDIEKAYEFFDTHFYDNNNYVESLTEDVMDSNYRTFIQRINRALQLLETYVDLSKGYASDSKDTDKKITKEGLEALKDLARYIPQKPNR